jgi:enoyl-CoA hydratase/3-hydroxyacyl-CoA dehydrogenase
MAKKSRFDHILTEKRGSVLWLTLNRPGRMNTFNLEMIDEVSTAIDEANADEEVRCVLVKGEGDKAFSAGADLTMFTGLDSESAIAA